MKTQIVVIGGGTTFDTYEEYISFLKNQDVDLHTFKSRRDWKSSLQEELGDSFEVLAPRMPNKTNARYAEWKIWFERMIPFIHDDVVFVGHSRGGIFLAKYLAEQTFPKSIKATVLVAAPFDDVGRGRSLTEFQLPSSLEKFTEQGGKIYLLHSKDDPVVSFDHLEKFKKALPNADFSIFSDRQHFNQEDVPEITQLLKDLE